MAGKPNPNSLRETAKRLTESLGQPVTVKMVRGWKAKCYDLDDPKKLRRSLRDQERNPLEKPKAKPATKKPEVAPPPPPPPQPPEDPAPGGLIDAEKVESELRELYRDLIHAEDYENARRIRTQISGVKDILKELREAGRYILKTDATVHASRAALTVRAELEKLEDALPPLLEGRSALQMKTRIRDYARGSMLELSKVFQ